MTVEEVAAAQAALEAAELVLQQAIVARDAAAETLFTARAALDADVTAGTDPLIEQAIADAQAAIGGAPIHRGLAEESM